MLRCHIFGILKYRYDFIYTVCISLTHQCTYLAKRDQHCCQAQKKLHTALAGAALHGQSFREFCLSVLAGYNLDKSHEHGVFLSWKCLESKHQLWHISGEVFSLSFRPPFSNTDPGYKYQSSYSKFKSTFLHLESFQNMWTCGPIFKLQPPQKSPKVRVITQCSSLWRRSWLH